MVMTDRGINKAKRWGQTIKWRFPVQWLTFMWLIFLEAGLALAVFLFIIWWTMRGKR